MCVFFVSDAWGRLQQVDWELVSGVVGCCLLKSEAWVGG